MGLEHNFSTRVLRRFGLSRIVAAVEPAPVLPEGVLFEVGGTCPLCEAPTTFRAYQPWLRDYFVCGTCGSVPRERALAAVLKQLRPDWRDLRIHECSPSARWMDRFAGACAHYTATQYDPDIAPGQLDPTGRFRIEDLEAQTFPDGSFDIVITQDVFEHLFAPDRAIAEIARTLAPDGMHICTVPLVRGARPSERRARREPTGEVAHLEPPDYHENPFSGQPALVTVDWGYDIADYFDRHGGLNTTIHAIDDLSRGIRAEFNEVLVSRKAAPPPI